MAKYKALIVGAGGMGKAWGRNLQAHPNTEIAGWVDIKPGLAAAAVEELKLDNVCRVGEDFGQALGDCRPDFVVDVTVPEAHRHITVQALSAGFPVIGEKPMASSMTHAREMVAASERAGKLYMVSQSRRYDARLAAFRKLIDEKIGTPGILNSDFYIGAHFGGFRDEMPSPLVLDMAIHTFDAARYLCDSDPVAVYCDEFNPPWSWYKGDACATAIFEMTNGLRYTYRGSWCSDGRHTSWDCDWRAVGPHGSATWDGNEEVIADCLAGDEGFFRPVETVKAEIDKEVPSGIAGSLRDFLNALESGATPMGECHDNIKSLGMVFAAIESAKTGKRVPVRV